jgi:hypothetical protein
MKTRILVLAVLAATFYSRAPAAETNLMIESSSGRVSLVAPCGDGTNQFFEINPKSPAYSTSNPVRDLNSLTTGAWSEPVPDGRGNRLRGRLQVYAGSHSTNASGRQVWTTAPVYVEIEDVTVANPHPTRIYFDMLGGLSFELRDANGAPADHLAHPASRGGIPPPFWATLPAGGRLRLRADAANVSAAGGDGELRLGFLDLQGRQSNVSWTIPAGDTNAWFLSATLLPPPATNSIPARPDVWRGTLEFPAAKLSLVQP